MHTTCLCIHFTSFLNPRPLSLRKARVFEQQAQILLKSAFVPFVSVSLFVKKRQPGIRRATGGELARRNGWLILSLTLETGVITTAYTPLLPFRAEKIYFLLYSFTLQQAVCLRCFSNLLSRRKGDLTQDSNEPDDRVPTRGNGFITCCWGFVVITVFSAQPDQCHVLVWLMLCCFASGVGINYAIRSLPPGSAPTYCWLLIQTYPFLWLPISSSLFSLFIFLFWHITHSHF